MKWTPSPQGKLDAEQRQILIQRGQELKDKLASVEKDLETVRVRRGRSR